MQDHEHLADLYAAYATGFDSVCERAIGLGKESEVSFPAVMNKVNAILKTLPQSAKENKDYFKAALQLEQKICQECEKICASGVSEGTKQLIGGLADLSEIRQYKIKQRIK